MTPRGLFVKKVGSLMLVLLLKSVSSLRPTSIISSNTIHTGRRLINFNKSSSSIAPTTSPRYHRPITRLQSSSRTSDDDNNNNKMKFLYCFDFDGVLVDSAAELGLSGYYAAEIMCPGASWLKRKLRRPDQMKHLIYNGFCSVRPCLETGWEAPLLIKLLTENEKYSIDDILQKFHQQEQSSADGSLREETLANLNVSIQQCKDALKQARDEWIESDSDGQDWLDAHQFYEGACDAVRSLLSQPDKAQDVYVITTKAADFTYRLLEQQKLAGKDAPNGGIPPERIFGLGSPPKEVVLANLLQEKGNDEEYGAVFVEDRLLTLDKTMTDSNVNTRVVPVVASWGYNTKEQCDGGKKAGYTVLDPKDSSSLASVLNDEGATKLLNALNENR